MAVFLQLCISIMCVGLGLLWWKVNRGRRMLQNLIPMQSSFGNLHRIWKKGDSAAELSSYSKLIDEGGKPLVMFVGPWPFIILQDPEDIKMVSNNFVEKPYMYRFSDSLLGGGLLTALFSRWKHTSKHLISVFNASMVDGYQGIFDAYARKFITCARAGPEGQPFDVSKIIAAVTLEAIYHVTLGVPSTAECGVTEEFHHKFRRALIMYLRRANNFLYHINFFYSFTEDYKKLKSIEAYLNKTLDAVVDQKRKERQVFNEINDNKNQSSKNTSLTGENTNGEKPFKSYLDVLFELNETSNLFTWGQVKSELHTIIAAGHETVAQAILHTLLLLGSHPEVQNKLYQEVLEILGDDENKPVTKYDLVQLLYCEAVINESLRLLPAVPVCTRVANKDLKMNSCTVPKGAICMLNIWGTGHSKLSWGDDAEQFRPERWLEPGPKPFFIPFSHGKRACIGKRYAIAIMKTMIARFVREFVVQSDVRDLKFKMVITMQPTCGHLVKLYRRKPTTLTDSRDLQC